MIAHASTVNARLEWDAATCDFGGGGIGAAKPRSHPERKEPANLI